MTDHEIGKMLKEAVDPNLRLYLGICPLQAGIRIIPVSVGLEA
jgi:hypothetical protein